MEHVKLREKIGYGLGDAASSMFWKLFTMYLLFFYTDVVGISAAVVGTMFLITRIWDTFLDPFIGILGDRTHSRFENSALICYGELYLSGYAAY